MTNPSDQYNRVPTGQGGMPSEESTLSEGVRTTINLLLFIHLFAVAVAVTSYTNPSSLQVRLRETLAPYLQSFNFDLVPNAYNAAIFHLTHATEDDVDFTIEIDGRRTDGTTPKQTIPPPGLWPPERRRRYQALANAVGALCGNDELRLVLPSAIAGGVARQLALTKGSIRVRGHLLQDVTDFDSADPARRDPYGENFFRTALEGSVVISPTEAIVIPKAAAGEVAPVDKGQK